MKKYIKADTSDHLGDDYVMGILRESLGYDEDDEDHDDEVLRFYDTNNSVFDALCDYNGLVDYGETIREMVLDVYGIDLDEFS